MRNNAIKSLEIGNTIVERCWSGLTGRFAKPWGSKVPRGFESHPLRHENLLSYVTRKLNKFMLPTWPEKLLDSKDEEGSHQFGFSWFPGELDDAFNKLADVAEPEDWDYHFTETEHNKPILFNYLKYTYQRLAQEKKIALSDDGGSAVFNTGLVTSHQEPIFAVFTANRRPDSNPWVFQDWYNRGQRGLNIFPELPDIAHYFDDPTCLVFDARKDFRVNIEHIIAGTPRERFPEPYKSMDDYALQTILRGTIDNAKERVRRSYKTAIPHFYSGEVQLLLPLCLDNPQRANLALVVERHSTFYRAATCLTLDMAYTDARLLAKPDRDWLKP